MARVTVRLPRVLTRLVSCAAEMGATGSTLGEVLRDVAEKNPALALHLFDDTDGVRHHVLCFVNDDGARGRAALDRRLEDGDVVTIVNSLAGG